MSKEKDKEKDKDDKKDDKQESSGAQQDREREDLFGVGG